METLEYALVIVLCINMMLVLGQIAALTVNPNLQNTIVDCKNSPLGQFGNCTAQGYTVNTNAPALPTSSTSVDATTGNVFTDIYNTVKGFFSDTLGLKYVVGIVGAPATFLKGMNIDPTFANVIGAVWWIFSVLVIIGYATSR